MALTLDQLLAAAFCEQVYRRADLDQQIGNNDSTEGYLPGLKAPVIETRTISGFTQQGGFYYNDQTGFVGQIIEANGSVFVVFRGSDLSGEFLSEPVISKKRERKGDASLYYCVTALSKLK
jgi:hypothetical protein